jgi:hypothetical protein
MKCVVKATERSALLTAVETDLTPHEGLPVLLLVFTYFFILLTAVGLSPGGSTHLHTNNT